MRIKLLGYLLILALNAAQSQKIQFSGEVSFVSDAPLEKIMARSVKLQGVIDLRENVFAFKVPVQSIKGFNSPLQEEHFHENYMETSKFPYATYQGKLLDYINVSKSGIQEIRSKGTFTIHGTSRERIIRNNVEVRNGKIFIKSEFFVHLEDHDISIPRIVQNKISEQIAVSLSAVAVWP